MGCLMKIVSFPFRLIYSWERAQLEAGMKLWDLVIILAIATGALWWMNH